ncbi:MAG: thiamine-phosphate kinase [Candidatus Omnitrophota bacterium]
MNEIAFIESLSRRVKTGRGVRRGIGDDAAVLDYTRSKYMLFASDMLIEGTHFVKGTAPYRVGWKAMAVNMSDIAAMGGVPRFALVSLGVPAAGRAGFLRGFYRGALAVCRRFGVSIVGGDTNASRQAVADVSMIGEVEKDLVATRGGAKAGDLIFVTGCLGQGKKKHLDFVPRVREARDLVTKFRINSMMDISDGLSLDLSRLCRASRVGAVVYESLLPLGGDRTGVEEAVGYGEDFELLFTLSLKEARRLIKYMGKTGHPPVSMIGTVGPASKGLIIVGDEGKRRRLKPRGFLHF